ncbi:MAG: hypothetical protein ACM3WU_04310 [Bacillota bacterium]
MLKDKMSDVIALVRNLKFTGISVNMGPIRLNLSVDPGSGQR